jgi:hypothetical protein
MTGRIGVFAHTMGRSSLLIIPLVFVLLWAQLNPVLGVAFTMDSYSDFLTGDNFVRHGNYASSSVRDFNGPRVFPQPNRSRPPVWPFFIGIFSRLTGLRIHSGVVANGCVLLAALIVFWWLSRAIALNQSYLFFAVLPLLVVFDGQFQLELAAARSMPTAVLWYLLCLACAWRWLDSRPLTRAYSIWTGVAMAALSLTRFDQTFFVGICLLALPLRVLVVDTRQGLREAAWAFGGFAILWLPWAIRNLVVFGTPVTSVDSASAASTHPGTYGLLFFAPGHTPPTLREAPGLWAEQRWSYLKVNAGVIYQSLRFLLLPVAVVIGLSWRRLQRRDRTFGGILAASALLLALSISLTSLHDRRYFTPVFLAFGIFGALALCRLLSGRRMIASVFTSGVWLVIVAAASPQAYRAVSKPDGFREKALGPRINQVQAEYAKLTPAIRKITGPDAVVAGPWAEEFSYYTGLRAISLPLDVPTLEDFDAWLVAWHPDYIWADPNWLNGMHQESWAVDPQPPTGYWIGWKLLKTRITK